MANEHIVDAHDVNALPDYILERNRTALAAGLTIERQDTTRGELTTWYRGSEAQWKASPFCHRTKPFPQNALGGGDISFFSPDTNLRHNTARRHEGDYRASIKSEILPTKITRVGEVVTYEMEPYYESGAHRVTIGPLERLIATGAAPPDAARQTKCEYKDGYASSTLWWHEPIADGRVAFFDCRRSDIGKRTMAERALDQPTRASGRNGVVLDLKTPALRNLMTEQCRTRSGWAMFYLGSEESFASAGLPTNLLPEDRGDREFLANGQPAFLRRKGILYELELHWERVGPAPCGAGHPSLQALADAVLGYAGYWFSNDAGVRIDELPLEKLRNYAESRGRDGPPNRRLKFADGSSTAISSLLFSLREAILNAEVMPVDQSPASEIKTISNDDLALLRTEIAADTAFHQFIAKTIQPATGAHDYRVPPQSP